MEGAGEEKDSLSPGETYAMGTQPLEAPRRVCETQAITQLYGRWSPVWQPSLRGSKHCSDSSKALGKKHPVGSQSTPARGKGSSVSPIKLGHLKRHTLTGSYNLMLHFEFVVLSKLFSSQLRS